MNRFVALEGHPPRRGRGGGPTARVEAMATDPRLRSSLSGSQIHLWTALVGKSVVSALADFKEIV